MLKRSTEKITWKSIIGHYPERLLEKWEMDLTFFWVGYHMAEKLIHSKAEFKHIINSQIIYISLIPYLDWIHSQWLTQGWLICLTCIHSFCQYFWIQILFLSLLRQNNIKGVLIIKELTINRKESKANIVIWCGYII